MFEVGDRVVVLKMSDGEIQYIPKRNACDYIVKIQ